MSASACARWVYVSLGDSVSKVVVSSCHHENCHQIPRILLVRSPLSFQQKSWQLAPLTLLTVMTVMTQLIQTRTARRLGLAGVMTWSGRPQKLQKHWSQMREISVPSKDGLVHEVRDLYAHYQDFQYEMDDHRLYDVIYDLTTVAHSVQTTFTCHVSFSCCQQASLHLALGFGVWVCDSWSVRNRIDRLNRLNSVVLVPGGFFRSAIILILPEKPTWPTCMKSHEVRLQVTPRYHCELLVARLFQLAVLRNVA